MQNTPLVSSAAPGSPAVGGTSSPNSLRVSCSHGKSYRASSHNILTANTDTAETPATRSSDSVMVPSVRNPAPLVLVESELLFSQSLKYLIESTMPGASSVIEASSVSEALRALATSPTALLLTEIDLGGPSGIELLLEIRRRQLPARCGVLTRERSVIALQRALGAGAQVLISKNAPTAELRAGLENLRAGRPYRSEELQGLLNEQLGNIGTESSDGGYHAKDPLAPLSPREREIFHQLASGLQNSTIAKKLFISPRTVETHRARIVRKLNLSSNAELIRYAIRHNLTNV